jgi:hypothetical protein
LPNSSAATVTNHRWGRFHGSLRHLTLLNHTTAIKNIGHPHKTDTKHSEKQGCCLPTSGYKITENGATRKLAFLNSAQQTSCFTEQCIADILLY